MFTFGNNLEEWQYKNSQVSFLRGGGDLFQNYMGHSLKSQPTWLQLITKIIKEPRVTCRMTPPPRNYALTVLHRPVPLPVMTLPKTHILKVSFSHRFKKISFQNPSLWKSTSPLWQNRFQHPKVFLSRYLLVLFNPPLASQASLHAHHK